MSATTPARLAAAAALRRLNHALVAHECDEDTLGELATVADRLAVRLAAGVRRDRASQLAEHAHRMFSLPSGSSSDDLVSGTDVHGVMSDRAVGGYANPTAVDVDVRYERDEAVATVVLGRAFEGAPGRAHGGVVAAVFDDVTGYVLRLAGTPAFTGRLSVAYHAPTPIDVPLEFRSRLAERLERKLLITAECRNGDEIVASAEATFITVDPERFRQLAQY